MFNIKTNIFGIKIDLKGKKGKERIFTIISAFAKVKDSRSGRGFSNMGQYGDCDSRLASKAFRELQLFIFVSFFLFLSFVAIFISKVPEIASPFSFPKFYNSLLQDIFCTKLFRTPKILN